MEIILKYLPLTGIFLNTAGVILLAIFSTPSKVLYPDGDCAFTVSLTEDKKELLRSEYARHRILTYFGYILLFCGITIQAIPTAIDTLK